MRTVKTRYNIVIAAPSSSYTPMFKGYATMEPTQKKIIDNEIAWARKLLKRNDRVVWFLKQVRPELMEEENATPSVRDIRRIVKHYMGVIEQQQFAKLARVAWVASDTPTELFEKLDAVEALEAEQKRLKESVLEGEPAFLKLPNGWQWQLLDRETCKKEGNAMGHCGNAAANPGDRILSLREPVKGGWVPHLTFILNKEGNIGESKGRSNSKPSDKYHPHILALLADSRVKGISGGGYKSKNNFKVKDLSEKNLDILLEKRPEFSNKKKSAEVIEALAEKIRNVDKAMSRYYTEDHEPYFEQYFEPEDITKNLNKETDAALDDYKIALKLLGREFDSKQFSDSSAVEIYFHLDYSADNLIGYVSVDDETAELDSDLQSEIEELTDAEQEELVEELSGEDFLYYPRSGEITLSCSGGWGQFINQKELENMVIELLDELEAEGKEITEDLDARYPKEKVRDDFPEIRQRAGPPRPARP